MVDEHTPQRFEHSITIDAPLGHVWWSLTDVDAIREWMGSEDMTVDVETAWQVGAPIAVRGVHHVPFENTGVVVALDPLRRLAYTHHSSLSHLPDVPESYTNLDFRLVSADRSTNLTLVASGFPTQTIYKHLDFYWRATLACLKSYAERPKANE